MAVVMGREASFELTMGGKTISGPIPSVPPIEPSQWSKDRATEVLAAGVKRCKRCKCGKCDTERLRCEPAKAASAHAMAALAIKIQGES